MYRYPFEPLDKKRMKIKTSKVCSILLLPIDYPHQFERYGHQLALKTPSLCRALFPDGIGIQALQGLDLDALHIAVELLLRTFLVVAFP